MSKRPDTQAGLAAVTDGAIAVINLESAREQAWSRFWRAPERPGLAAIVAEHELLTAQFRGDVGALDRLESLAEQCARASPNAPETALVAAQAAGALHRFAEARAHLRQAADHGAAPEAIERASLSLDQATGADLERVLAARRRRLRDAGHWEDWIPLAALLADLGAFDEAELTFHHALQAYRDVSPFAPAWVCFELGMLWGERVASPEPEHAAAWYRRAIEYVPTYVRARVHLAEILLDAREIDAAREILEPALASGDPEAAWRRAEIEISTSNPQAASTWQALARDAFEMLLAKHTLAFADHGVEFFLALGDDPECALALAQRNLANRPTPRAFELACEAAVAAGKPDVAAAIAAEAADRWRGIAAFRDSPLAENSDTDAGSACTIETSTHARP